MDFGFMIGVVGLGILALLIAGIVYLVSRSRGGQAVRVPFRAIVRVYIYVVILVGMGLTILGGVSNLIKVGFGEAFGAEFSYREAYAPFKYARAYPPEPALRRERTGEDTSEPALRPERTGDDTSEPALRPERTGDDTSALNKPAPGSDKPEERDLTKEEIIDFYRDGLIDAAKTTGLLLGVGYSQEEADLLFTQETLRIDGADRDLEQRVDRAREGTVINGVSLMIIGAIIWLVHAFGRRRLETEEERGDILNKAYLIAALLMFTIAAIVSLVTGIPETLRYFFLDSLDRRGSPGGPLAVAVVALPIWICYLILTLRATIKSSHLNTETPGESQ